MCIFCDNKAAISIVHNLVLHDRRKYLKVDKHFIKEKIDVRVTQIPYPSTTKQIVNLLTKGFSKLQFNKLIDRLVSSNQLPGKCGLFPFVLINFLCLLYYL